MSNLSAIVLCLAVVVCISLELRRDVRRIVSGYCVVLLALIVWFLAEAVRVPEAIRVGYVQSDYNYAIGCIALAFVMFMIGYHYTNYRLFNGFGHRLLVLESGTLVWKLFLVALGIGLAPIMFFSDFDISILFEGLGTPNRKRWSGALSRGRYGGFRDAMLELQLFLKAALPLAIAVVLTPRMFLVRRIIAGLFVLWMLLRAMGSFTRSDLIHTALPILGGVYCRLAPTWQRRGVYVLPLIAALGYIWSTAVVVSRTKGQFDWDAREQAAYAGNEMFRELLFITTRVPDSLPYLNGTTYVTQLVNPIPRFIWPSKPTSDAGLLLAQAAGEVDATGEAYLTRSPGAIGEMYWNFGLFGVAGLSALLGVVVRSWDALREPGLQSPLVFLVYCAGLAALFLSGRSFTMNIYYGLLAIGGLVFLACRNTQVSQSAGK